MNAEKRLFKAIDDIDDKYIVEAYTYKKKNPAKISALSFVAACACLCIVMTFVISRIGAAPISVYAYGSNQEIGWQKPTLMNGTITDDGEMHGSPLQFYITGKSIKKIYFSVKNEYISFMDWTKIREAYGYSKGFTVNYGDESDYYYLVINWEPISLIRKLTDNPSIRIKDLSKNEREDVIVMEITYNNGDKKSYAINITLTDKGTFETKVEQYNLSDSDGVSRGEIDNKQKSASGNSQKNGGEKRNMDPDYKKNVGNDMNANSNQRTIPQADLSNIKKYAKEYYASLHYDVIDMIPDDDETKQQESNYIGYNPDEILVIKVTIKDSNIPRYITLGSKDGWKNCSILNEGY